MTTATAQFALTLTSESDLFGAAAVRAKVREIIDARVLLPQAMIAADLPATVFGIDAELSILKPAMASAGKEVTRLAKLMASMRGGFPVDPDFAALMTAKGDAGDREFNIVRRYKLLIAAREAAKRAG